MPLAITTPTGHIGSALVRQLLDAGRRDLVLLLRDASRLDPDVRDAVDAREGEVQDADYVRQATEGADALFWLNPSDWTTPSLFDWYRDLGRSAAGAVEANGIGHVVHLSSEGAQDRAGHGPVSGLGRVEDALDRTGAAVRHLRPGFFFENFEAQVPAIAGAGAVFFPRPPETTTSMIATADIAQRAADLLLDLSWSGRGVVPLMGPSDLSYAEAADVLSDALGRPVAVQQVPPDAVRQQFLDMGATDEWADGLVTLYTKIGTPGYREGQRTPEAATSTELADWARRSLRPMVEAAGAQGGPA